MRGLHAFGVDDDTVHTLALRQILFLVWVTFAEHKWVILGERRRVEHQFTKHHASAPLNATVKKETEIHVQV